MKMVTILLDKSCSYDMVVWNMKRGSEAIELGYSIINEPQIA